MQEIQNIFTIQNFLIYLIVINIVGVLVMYVDKQKAKKGQWRIPEKILFIITAIGGGIGSYIGMKKFRHKTQKLGFVIGIPFITILEIVLIIYLFVE